MACSCESYGSYIGNFNCPSSSLPNTGLPCPNPTGPIYDVATITYQGAPLTCTGIATGDTLDTVINKINSKVCTALGDVSTFNTQCITTDGTLKGFIEGVSAYACATQRALSDFVSGQFLTYQDSVTARFTAIQQPGLIGCGSSGILFGDSLNTIITKLSNKICDVYDVQLNLSSVNWGQCFAVPTPPNSIAAGFNLLSTEICQINAYLNETGLGGSLPTFNTSSSCLPSPQAADTLVSTVNKLIVRSCQTPTFDTSTLNWGCVTKPNNVQTDLQSAFQTVLTNLGNHNTNFPSSYSSDFSVTAVDPTNPCLGKRIALAIPSAQDRFVASTPDDVTPGTLIQKLQPGSNINLDFTSTPGVVIINGSAGNTGNKVAVSAQDPLPDYLPNKVEAGTGQYGITVSPVLDLATNKVAFNVAVDLSTLAAAIIGLLTPGTTLGNQFCAVMAACPSPCAPPSNVTVTYNSTGSTTTTTTTTV